jgi:hypothetical protein
MSLKSFAQALLLVICIVMLISCRGSREHHIPIEIPASSSWVDTGVDVTNKTVHIKYVSGNWSNDGGAHTCDGEGFIPESNDFRDLIPKLILSNAPLGALIGKTNDAPFFVGNTYEDRPGEGHLFLSINDKPDSLDDNNGSLRIELWVTD